MVFAQHRVGRRRGRNHDDPGSAVSYAAPLIGAAQLAAALGLMLFAHYPVQTALIQAMIGILLNFGIVLGARRRSSTDWRPTFGAQKDFTQSLKVAVYSMTPLWVFAPARHHPAARHHRAAAGAVFAVPDLRRPAQGQAPQEGPGGGLCARRHRRHHHPHHRRLSSCWASSCAASRATERSRAVGGRGGGFSASGNAARNAEKPYPVPRRSRAARRLRGRRDAPRQHGAAFRLVRRRAWFSVLVAGPHGKCRRFRRARRTAAAALIRVAQPWLATRAVALVWSLGTAAFFTWLARDRIDISLLGVPTGSRSAPPFSATSARADCCSATTFSAARGVRRCARCWPTRCSR